jgi:dienelactone hydrolase
MKLALLLLACCGTCFTQEPRFVYPLPPTATVTTTSATYQNTGAASLGLDLFRPATITRGQRFPILVIFNGFGGSAMRTSPQSHAWAKAATVHGFAAVTAETTAGHVAEDFDSLVAYLGQRAADLHIDPERIAMIAWSGNVSAGLPVAEDPKRKAIKAAVFYYGAADIKQVRLDLPVLLVRAGLDQPATNHLVDQTIAAGLAANAPWTVLNYPAGHHGFDFLDDNDFSRDVVEQTFQFLQLALSSSHQGALHAGLPEATAAGAMATGDYEKAAALYAALAQDRPQDARVLLAYGNALLGAQRYHQARVQFDRIQAIGRAGVGPRDLAIPAAQACALDNDPEAAIAWLKTIPARFLPASVQSDPAFATLKNRPDFQALFRQQ